MIERYLHLHSHKYYDTIIILEFLQFLLSAFKNVLRKKTAFKPKTIEMRKGAFSPFCDLRITIHIPDHNGWDPCEVLLSFPFNFHWFRRRKCLNKGVKLTLREGEGSKTWIHKTTKFNLCFQEVFQQIMTGIADFRRYCSSCWAHFQTTAGDCEPA